MKLRCMAYQQGDMYIAACLDLSLAAQANSIDEAFSKLKAQVSDYLEEIAAEPKYAKQLMNRKAPISMWLKYWYIAFKLKVRRSSYLNKETISVKLFDEQCELAR
ncbi:DUF1902 domain-containing protein [Xenorhabdus innexi]|uniref:DUF1902 domain-containing protein n=1 Tax=Xenorhabdus innexi TaxID=290109 RepID=A0A1N6N0V7_9GAMM|nr:DUF1902 domain-containing protein [Xenorhabdus innexi]PHM36450.1 hypothetical protein Xinn_01589 [Xenorhabdus innexi]SIP74731.1 conserved hypothetical protein [Xenorhabdus innexi]